MKKGLKKPRATREYEDLIKRAQSQPGIDDLMRAYGHYDILVKRSRAYLTNARPRIVISTTNSTS